MNNLSQIIIKYPSEICLLLERFQLPIALDYLYRIFQSYRLYSTLYLYMYTVRL